ncbi:hypothetical protein BKA70DRAFT_1242612 [Coprinopsis sp. MPI-PUGE-AT-0042]|nr:hypothetical protein BKA70DRAFT_1242612 [Coprinopsis sp. MPI-PUGE-AT-0042]
MSVAIQSTHYQTVHQKVREGRPLGSKASAMAKTGPPSSVSSQWSAQIGESQLHSSKHTETAYKAGSGLPSPRASLDVSRAPSVVPDNNEGAQDSDIHHASNQCHHCNMGYIVPADTEPVVQIELDSHPGTHRASVVVTTPKGTRLNCTICGINYRVEFDRRVSSTPSISSIAHSLQSLSDHGDNGSSESVDEPAEFLIPSLAHHFQTSRAIMEAQESLAHTLLHTTNRKEIINQWHAQNAETEEVVMQVMPTLARKLGQSASLLIPDMTHLENIQTAVDMRELESRVDGLFVQVPAPDRKELESQVNEVFVKNDRDDGTMACNMMRPC